MGDSLKKRDVLLGLPRLIGPHCCVAAYVEEVIVHYEVNSELGNFMLVNAESTSLHEDIRVKLYYGEQFLRWLAGIIRLYYGVG